MVALVVACGSHNLDLCCGVYFAMRNTQKSVEKAGENPAFSLGVKPLAGRLKNSQGASAVPLEVQPPGENWSFLKAAFREKSYQGIKGQIPAFALRNWASRPITGRGAESEKREPRGETALGAGTVTNRGDAAAMVA